MYWPEMKISWLVLTVNCYVLIIQYEEVIVTKANLISGRDKVIAVVLLVAGVANIGVHLLIAVKAVKILEPVVV